MKNFILVGIFIIQALFQSLHAEKIYVLFWKYDSTSYTDFCEHSIIDKIKTNGHTVTINYNPNSFPTVFHSTCYDPINGFDWLCMFGNYNYQSIFPQIQSFINEGGKVFCNYDINRDQAYDGFSIITTKLTGNYIVPNINYSIADIASFNPGWMAELGCINIFGIAYKGMDGIPTKNQLQATKTLNGATPEISLCLNFGFVFSTSDFIGNKKMGGIIGFGDINAWIDGSWLPPYGNGKINLNLINYFFPNDTTTCYLFPPGCLKVYVNLGKDDYFCGNPYMLNATHGAGASYLWQDGSTDSVYWVTKPGMYWVQVILDGDTATDTIVFYNNIFNIDKMICKDEVFVFDDFPKTGNYIWQDGSTSPYYGINQAGYYTLKVIKEDGCYIIYNFNVTKCTHPLTIPNVFTPNGDGKNDQFTYQNQEDWEFSTTIYNRWGQLIYENKESKNWDGSYKGKPVSDGVYFYIVDATALSSGEKKRFQGSVTVIR